MSQSSDAVVVCRRRRGSQAEQTEPGTTRQSRRLRRDATVCSPDVALTPDVVAPRSDDVTLPSPHGVVLPSPHGVALPRVVAEAAPVASRLVWLLAPWDRARLRLTCRALADAVPARSCALSLSAMVRAGGTELLRYGAGDARPRDVHVLIAVEADAVDALRWMQSRGDVWRVAGSDAFSLLLRLQALRQGSVGVWRLAGGRASTPASQVNDMLHSAIRGGLVCIAAQYAEDLAAAMAVGSAGPASYAEHGARQAIHLASRRDMPAVVVAFLRLGDRFPVVCHKAAQALFRMGHGSLAGPCDTAELFGASLLRKAAMAGEVALVDAELRRLPARVDAKLRRHLDRGDEELGRRQSFGVGPHAALDGRYRVLLWAMRARRNAAAMLDAVTAALALDADELRTAGPALAPVAVDGDGADALRWLVERAGYAPDDELLYRAAATDAVACVAYLMDLGVGAVADVLACTMGMWSWRVTALVASRADRPLGVRAFLQLAFMNAMDDRRAYETDNRRTYAMRAASLLRKHALVPAPCEGFLRVCTESGHDEASLRLLAAAGYRIDADLCTWLASVEPHCDGRRWRELASELHGRWHALCQ